MRPGLRALAGLFATACSSVSHRPDVAARVAAVDRAWLEEEVRALVALGPRPVSDEDATRAAVVHLATRLRALGYEVREEPVEVTLPETVLARVRPLGRPDAEPTELPMPPDLLLGGPNAAHAAGESLRREGWALESYVSRGQAEHVVSNVLATRPRDAGLDGFVELSAHYDTVVASPGADDDASGVAALLEVARVLADAPTRHALRFTFFGAEEAHLVGSRAHVRALLERGAEDPDERLVGLVNLDGVGVTATGPGSQHAPEGVPWFLFFPDEADFLVVAGRWSSGWLGNVVEDAARTYAPGLPVYSANRLGSRFPDAGRGDHAPYWEADLPAVFLTDTAEFRTEHYHRPTDTLERLDLAFLESVTRVVAAAALHLAEPLP